MTRAEPVIHTLSGTRFVPDERGLGVPLPPPRPTRPYYVTTSTSPSWDEVRALGDTEDVLGYVTVANAGLPVQVFEARVLKGGRTVPAPYGFARQDLAARWVADQHVVT